MLNVGPGALVTVLDAVEFVRNKPGVAVFLLRASSDAIFARSLAVAMVAEMIEGIYAVQFMLRMRPNAVNCNGDTNYGSVC